MISENQLSEEMLEEVSGGARRRSTYNGTKTMATKYTKIACPKCGATLKVDINNADHVRCDKCGHKAVLAG